MSVSIYLLNISVKQVLSIQEKVLIAYFSGKSEEKPSTIRIRFLEPSFCWMREEWQRNICRSLALSRIHTYIRSDIPSTGKVM